MGKLKNLDTIRQVLDGRHKSQTKKTISTNSDGSGRRKVGDVWYDKDGFKWEQRNGFKVKVGKMAALREELRDFKNCKEGCESHKNPSKADMKMNAYNGMCLKCVIEEEHEMKVKGVYESYETAKMLKNAESWLREAKKEKEVYKKMLRTTFVNEDGSTEEWDGVDIDALCEKVDAEFEEIEKNIFDRIKERRNGKHETNGEKEEFSEEHASG